MPGPSKKRAADSLDEGPAPAKHPKATHPFFLPRAPARVVWQPPPARTCLHGAHGAPTVPARKVAAFDLDGTLIKTKSGNAYPRDAHDWVWWDRRVPQRLAALHEEGFAVVIVSNQGSTRQKSREQWKLKIPLIATQIQDVPFRVFAALDRDGFRKPMPGIWEELEKINQGVDIDKSQSFFVGDAAGRPGDHSDCDRKWALNIGIPFFTPEEFFLAAPPAPFTLRGFDPAALSADLPLYTPTSSPLVSAGPGPELVLFVGYPASGKTSLFRRHFEPAGYAHVNQDALKTRARCTKAVEARLREGTSCVVDNTNRNVATRKEYLDVCAKLGVPARCIELTTSLQLAWHNNLYRAYAAAEPKRPAPLPVAAFTSFRAAYAAPTLAEGFAEIKRVHWRFEGDADARRRWGMWLEVDKVDWLVGGE